VAVRFDNTGESYSRNQALGVVTSWSVACWVKMMVDRATTTVPWQIDASAGSSRLRINAWNGHDLTFQTDSGGWFANVGHTLVAGEWTYIGFSGTSNPGEARVAVRTAGSSSFVGGTSSQANVTFNANILRIGCSSSTSEFLNGSMAAVKVWDAAMTEAELQLEAWTYMPQRTANLRAWYPLLKPDPNDASGNGQTLSGGTGTTLDDGPPISWSTGRHRIVIPTASTPVSGTLAGTLPAATASTTGAVKVSGTLAGVAPAATASLSGDVNTNHLAGVLPAATASMDATVEVSGSAAATLPAAVGAFAGEVEIPANDITVTAGTMTRGWNAAPVDQPWGSGAAGRGWKTGTPTT